MKKEIVEFKLNCSALILTFDEEINIARCIESLQWCDDIVILDSNSTDKTIEIAGKYKNVRIITKEFMGYASQRSFGLDKIDYKHNWVIMVDADEIVEKELADEILNLSENDASIFRMRRKDIFWGSWLKKSSGYPTWFGRLMRIGHVRIEREVNEEFTTSGKVLNLKHHLVHYPFNKGVEWWFERHNKYSSMEAELVFYGKDANLKLKNIFTRDLVLRRKHLKALLYKLPMRPFLVFAYLYFFKGGFLDGISGLRFSIIRSFYEYMIDLKIKEMKVRGDDNF